MVDQDKLNDLAIARSEEQGLIASLLLEPHLIEDVRHMLTPSMFVSAWCGNTFRAMLAVDDFTEAPLVRQLEKQGHLRDMGGSKSVRDWLFYLADELPSAGFAEIWARRIHTRGIKAMVAEAAKKAVRVAENGAASLEEVDGLLSMAVDTIQRADTGDTDRDGRQAIGNYIENVQSGTDNHISTQYRGLDSKGLLVPGGLYTVAARSGEGKSSLIANFAERFQRNEVPFGLVTVEMTEHQMVNSMIGVRTGINRRELLKNHLTSEQQSSRDDAANSLIGGWHISDQEGQRAEDIVAQARAWVRRYGIKVLLVDHLQRIKATDPSLPRHLQVGHITWALKGLARQMGIVVILAVQINREGAREGQPKLHHLKESGSVEEDSDGVIAIYVDRAKNSLDSLVWEAELWWLKNRHGAIGSCPITFQKTSGRMLEHDTREDTTDGRYEQAYGREDEH